MFNKLGMLRSAVQTGADSLKHPTAEYIVHIKASYKTEKQQQLQPPWVNYRSLRG